MSKLLPNIGISMSESILSLSEFKADASRLLDQIRADPATLVLTQNGRARAVVEDYEQYQARQRALVMLKLMVQGERDLEAGRVVPQEQVFADLRRRLEAGDPADD
jgi:prevent-host-death family protein